MNILSRFRKDKIPATVPIVNDDIDERFSYVEKQPLREEEIQKSANGKEKAEVNPTSPIVGSVDIGRGHRTKRNAENIETRPDMLNRIANNIIVDTIITTRANQVAGFGAPASQDTGMQGFELALKDPNAKVTKKEREEMQYLESFFQYTGDNRHYSLGEDVPDPLRDTFRTSIRKIVRDIFVHDQVNLELIWEEGVGSKLLGFKVVDASTIRIATEKHTGRLPTRRNDIRYVQVKEVDTIIARFKRGELTFNVMKPRSDVNTGGYGTSPLEISMHHIGYHHMTESFNHRYFSQGGTTMGLLHIKTGDQSSTGALEDFRRDWTNLFGGTSGAWKIPVVTADEVKYINMNQSSRDMEFEKWLTYLINVICADFGIDPAEINFPNRGGATGSKGNSLQESSKKETSDLSKNKGLEPILTFIADIMNQNIMPHFYGGKYIFRFRGDNLSKEMQLLEKEKLESETSVTVNEIRKRKGLSPIAGGDVIMSAHFVQNMGRLDSKASVEYERKKARIDTMLTQIGEQDEPEIPFEPSTAKTKGTNDDAVTFQDKQRAEAGKLPKMGDTKKDGQQRGTKSANATVKTEQQRKKDNN